MPSIWTFVAAGVALLIVAAVAGRIRSESPLEIALTAAGSLAFITGLAWASALGAEAFLAAAAASGGMALTAEVMRVGRRRAERGATAPGAGRRADSC